MLLSLPPQQWAYEHTPPQLDYTSHFKCEFWEVEFRSSSSACTAEDFAQFFPCDFSLIAAACLTSKPADE